MQFFEIRRSIPLLVWRCAAKRKNFSAAGPDFLRRDSDFLSQWAPAILENYFNRR
jgi:hypothetical protein